MSRAEAKLRVFKRAPGARAVDQDMGILTKQHNALKPCDRGNVCWVLWNGTIVYGTANSSRSA